MYTQNVFSDRCEFLIPDVLEIKMDYQIPCISFYLLHRKMHTRTRALISWKTLFPQENHTITITRTAIPFFSMCKNPIYWCYLCWMFWVPVLFYWYFEICCILCMLLIIYKVCCTSLPDTLLIFTGFWKTKNVGYWYFITKNNNN